MFERRCRRASCEGKALLLKAVQAATKDMKAPKLAQEAGEGAGKGGIHAATESMTRRERLAAQRSTSVNYTSTTSTPEIRASVTSGTVSTAKVQTSRRSQAASRSYEQG